MASVDNPDDIFLFLSQIVDIAKTAAEDCAVRVDRSGNYIGL